MLSKVCVQETWVFFSDQKLESCIEHPLFSMFGNGHACVCRSGLLTVRGLQSTAETRRRPRTERPAWGFRYAGQHTGDIQNTEDSQWFWWLYMEDQESHPYINTIFCNLIMSCEIKYAKRHRNEIEKDWWKRKKRRYCLFIWLFQFLKISFLMQNSKICF